MEIKDTAHHIRTELSHDMRRDVTDARYRTQDSGALVDQHQGVSHVRIDTGARLLERGNPQSEATPTGFSSDTPRHSVLHDRHQRDLRPHRPVRAESYLDTGNRSGFFNNGGAYLEAHPDFRPKHWAETCVPLVFEGAAVQKGRGDLRDRAVALGYALTDDPDVHAVVDGQRVEPARLGAERVAFLLPEGGSHIELRSRTFIPAHITPENPDTRSLGHCVFRLQIDGEVAALDDEAQFRSGWNELERHEHGRRRRWSRDRMPLPAGTRLVVIDMHRQNPVYFREPAVAVLAEAHRGSPAAARG